VNCPICGYTTTRVNDNYWCPSDRIYIGQGLAVQTPIVTTPQPAFEQPYKNTRSSNLLNNLVWIVMGVLYVVVIILVVWSVLNGSFGDTGSIYN
jgi:hypothetical protein